MYNLLFVGMRDIIRGLFSDLSLHFRPSKQKIREEGQFSPVSFSVCKPYVYLNNPTRLHI